MKVHAGAFVFRDQDTLYVNPSEGGDTVQVHVFDTMEATAQRQMKRGVIYYFRNGNRWCVSIRGPKKSACVPGSGVL